MIAHALWVTAPGTTERRAETLPARAAKQSLIRTRITGISRGTERLVLAGRVPPSQYAAMGAPLMAGAFPFPVKYGYSAAGVVEAGPNPGQRIFCLHPHQDLFLAPSAMCIAIPDAVPDARAALAANMETALNILWDARPLAGERALVIGAGVVGLLTAFLLARIPGLDVTVTDPDSTRAPLATALGARFTAPEEAPAERELIIHASANPAGLQHALTLAAFEARIIEASWYGDRAVPLPLGEAFHARRLRLLSTQVGSVAPAMRGRRTHAERLALALTLLDDARLDALIGPATPFDDLPARYAALLNPPPGRPAPLCPIVTYA